MTPLPQFPEGTLVTTSTGSKNTDVDHRFQLGILVVVQGQEEGNVVAAGNNVLDAGAVGAIFLDHTETVAVLAVVECGTGGKRNAGHFHQRTAVHLHCLCDAHQGE